MAKKRRSNLSKATDINKQSENMILESTPDSKNVIKNSSLRMEIPEIQQVISEAPEPNYFINFDPQPWMPPTPIPDPEPWPEPTPTPPKPEPTPDPEPEPTPEPEPEPSYKKLYTVKVTVPKLYMRGGPGYNYPTYDILEGYPILDIYQEKNEFGLLNNGHWIALQYTEKI